jgi:superfamily II RNA helicase
MPDPARLDERIPETGFAKPDDMLDAFLAWVADRGVELYPHQEASILELFSGNHVVLDAPTGSGKSLVAVALHYRTFVNLGRAWYTAPIKALVSEKFFELCRTFGPEHVGMITGDGAVNRDAPIICCTAEILANLALREGPAARVTSVVMDEFHYYGDRDRGMAWQIPLLTLPNTQFLLMSATLGDTAAIRADLEARTQRKVVDVRGVHRPVPLEFSYSLHPIHEALANLTRGGNAPIYVVHFTQNAAAEQAQALMSVDFCTKEEKRVIQEALRGFSFHSPFGPTLRRFVTHGVGLHHAGLLPRYRLLVERLAQQGLLKMICGTDTLGVGINVPIRTVLFTQLCKFDGEQTIILPVREFKQIAGRAGRAGFDSIGYVVAQAPAHVIENARVRAGDPKKLKKQVKAQPPTKGYRHWDDTTFQQLIERPPEPLESQFSVTHGHLLALLQHHQDTGGDAATGFQAMLALIDACHATPKRKEQLKAEAQSLLANLEAAGVVWRSGDRLELDPSLQHDFSLHHSLSLFLLDAIATVDPASPTHALDIITWVESILEHPRAILQRQVDRAKQEKLAELKAAGVPFEERVEALEDIGWPKPNADQIYAYFNAYRVHHPWLSDEAIRPKSIAREMAERAASFTEYVGELGLQRSEGVLLRYLAEVYKALEQNVPLDDQSDALVELMAYFRTMLGHVDSSLVTEWEAMLAGKDKPADQPHKVDISADRRAFVARVRAELHALVRELSRRDWEAAAQAIKSDEDWGPAEFEAALQPFLDAHPDVAFDHRSKQAVHTTVRATGPHQWEVRQRVFPPARPEVDQWTLEGHTDESNEESWAIEGRIDLRDDTNPDGPIVQMVSFGE